MALVQIADVIVPSVFTNYLQKIIPERSALVAAGVIERSPLFDGLLEGGGKTFDLPSFQDIDPSIEPNVSTDQGVGVNDAVPQKIATLREVAIRHNLNQVWSAADLAGALAGADPMEAIASRVAEYWIRQINRIVVRTLRGLFADNVANDAGDMVQNIAVGSSGTPTSTNLFSAESFIDAIQTAGDVGENLAAVAVHSVVYRRMQKLNLIDFVPDSQGQVNIPTYLGRRVIVDDQLTPVTNGSNLEYTTYLFGGNALAWGQGTPRVPTEVHREPLAGKGGGQEFLTNRVEWLVHPRGFRWTSASMAGQSPTYTELATTANWDRSAGLQRRQVPLAELRTNG